MQAARATSRQSKQLARVMRLHRDLAALAPEPQLIERRSALSRDEFFRHYYCRNRPVVLTDVVPRWRAATRWSPDDFRERFGDVEIAVTDGREADDDYDINTPQHTRRVPMRDFVDRVRAIGESNDTYMVANNRNLDVTLRALLDDVDQGDAAPDYLDRSKLDGCVCLWFGPSGTITPLHHDTTNILFCQVMGRKRVRLISPLEGALLGSTRGVYNLVDPERPDLGRFPWFSEVAQHEVTVAPGDALFIPVGWWHHVRSLAVSISLSFTNFHLPNYFDDYRPGELR